MNSSGIKIWFIWFAKVCNLSLAVCLYATLISAFFGGSGVVVVTVNGYGEGAIEFVVLTLIIMLIVAGYAYEWRKK